MQAVPTSLALILGLPLAGFLVQALLGGAVVRALGVSRGRTVMGWAAFLFVFVPFVFAVQVVSALMGATAEDRTVVATLFDWLRLQSLVVPFELRADSLSMTMTLVVTGIGSLIHMYAIKYMFEDRDFTRFFTYLNLFIAFMLLLVLGNNLVMLFVGWEGVGLCSYLLIGYWYKDTANARAANKAFITNRVGDWGLTLGIFLIAVLAATTLGGEAGLDGRWLSYDVVLPRLAEVFAGQPYLATVAALLLFIGAMGKSAQFPLYVWLPDAMAGPTPVSALIHAATMVTAGVFLLNRMSALFAMSPVAQAVVVVIGALTALIGALIAFGQTDIKKVLAYSTVSQLGYMFIACGVGAYWAGIFHVVTHAFFKALLFLGSGAVIYAMAHNQDMRNYGNLKKYIPVTYWTMFVGWAAIAGIPFFAGFYSKEAILGAAVNGPASEYMVGPLTLTQAAGWLGFLVALLTAAYMTRMMMLTFAEGEERWKDAKPATHAHHSHHAHAHAHHDDPHGFFYTDEEMAAIPEEHEHHEELGPEFAPKKVPWEMLLPLVVLAVGSTLLTGYFMERGQAFAHWLYPGLPEAGHHAIGTNMLITISLVVAFFGIAYGYFTYHGKKLGENEGWDTGKWSAFRRASYKQFGFDAVLADGSVKTGGVLGAVLAWMDKWIVDGLVNLAGILTRSLAGTGKWFQTGYVRTYALVMQLGVAGVVLYTIYLWLNGGR
jgi:NADH-quinone oxidoreductase subunit L